MTVYLVPIGRDRFEIYSEAPEEPAPPPGAHESRWRHWVHAAVMQWHGLVDNARQAPATTRFGRWRDRVVCRLAETIAEQRTLWALSSEQAATLVFPSTMTADAARPTVMRLLARARRHHGLWLAIDVPLLLASGLLIPLPGPNVPGYYFTFRSVTHFLSWRGAGRSLTRITWSFVADHSLAELQSLVSLPRSARAARVRDIAHRLNLQRLPAFFDRAAA